MIFSINIVNIGC